MGFGEGESLKATDVVTRRSSVICTMSGSLNGASWSSDGETIVFSASGDLYEVPAIGGDPRRLLEATDDEVYRHPSHLPAPAANALVFTATPPRDNTGREALIRLLDVGTLQSKDLTAGHQAVYSPSGHLLVWNEAENTIRGLPFSLGSLEVTGEGLVVAEDADRPSVTNDVTLLYAPPRGERQLALLQRDDTATRPIGLPMQRITDPTFSPDGKRIVLMGEREDNPDIWVYDIEAGTMTRLTVGDDAEAYPAWSPDGSQIAYLVQGGTSGVYSRSSAGGGEPRRLSDEVFHVDEWVDDGATMLGHTHSGNRGDLFQMVRQADGSFHREILVSTAARDHSPQLSPNGRWLAFGSGMSGRNEVYVQPYPDAEDQRIQVSSNGGTHPRWSRDGRELLFMEDENLVALSVDSGDSFRVLDREELLGSAMLITTGRYRYDVSPDGRTFVVVVEVDPGEGDVLNVIQNWAASYQ